MKKTSILIAIVIMVITVGSVLASGTLPGSGWYSGEQIQNIGSSAAKVDIAAYDASSVAVYTSTTMIDPGGSDTFMPADFAGMSSGFMGSAIVTSDQEIRAITNVTNLRRDPLDLGVVGGKAAAQYQGMHQVDTKLYFPVAKNDYFDNTTTYYIQNASATEAPAYATFYAGGSTYTYTTPPIEPGKMVVISPSDATGMPSGDTSGFGSVVVTSTQMIAGVVMEHHTTENPAIYLGGTRAFTTNDEDDLLFSPQIKNNFADRFTILYVMNTNTTGNIDVTVTYRKINRCGDETGPWVDTFTGLGPGEMHTFVHLAGQSNLTPGYTDPNDGKLGCLASATVEIAGGNAVGIVRESYMDAYLTLGNDEAVVYNSSFPESAGTQKISVPLYKEFSRGKWTGLLVQNLAGVDATNVVLVFSSSGGTYTTTPQTIPAYNGVTFLQMRLKDASMWDGTAMTDASLGCDPDCKANGVFGVIITADQNVVAVLNESPYPNVAEPILQDKNMYEGFNLIP